MCWPRTGAPRATPAGVAENLTGAPIVSTRFGARGLGFEPGRHSGQVRGSEGGALRDGDHVDGQPGAVGQRLHPRGALHAAAGRRYERYRELSEAGG